jgi:multicomponent Na+:H+ antiporter subunit D
VLFLAAGMALVRFGVRDVADLNRLRGRAPWTTLAVVVVAGLSLVGVPPLSGFFGKWYVLSGALEDERWGSPPRWSWAAWPAWATSSA